LYALSVVPVLLGTSALLFSAWPWLVAAKHLLVLALVGSALAELCLHGTPKLPFTCSYLPGKSNFNISFLLCSILIFVVIVAVSKMERDSFENAPAYAAIVAVLLALGICARWSVSRLARSPEGELRFEEAADPAIFSLDLHRDGVTPITFSPDSDAPTTDKGSNPARQHNND
jgi:hypothetical protein